MVRLALHVGVRRTDTGRLTLLREADLPASDSAPGVPFSLRIGGSPEPLAGSRWWVFPQAGKDGRYRFDYLVSHGLQDGAGRAPSGQGEQVGGAAAGLGTPTNPAPADGDPATPPPANGTAKNAQASFIGLPPAEVIVITVNPAPGYAAVSGGSDLVIAPRAPSPGPVQAGLLEAAGLLAYLKAQDAAFAGSLGWPELAASTKGPLPDDRGPGLLDLQVIGLI
jgi:hypothetical protein